MRKIYVKQVHNLKTAIDKCPPPIWDQDKAKFKVAYTVLLRNHALPNIFDTKYTPMQTDLW